VRRFSLAILATRARLGSRFIDENGGGAGVCLPSGSDRGREDYIPRPPPYGAHRRIKIRGVAEAVRGKAKKRPEFWSSVARHPIDLSIWSGASRS